MKSGQLLTRTWLVDTGATISQVGMGAASMLWSSLLPVGKVKVCCRTAMARTTVDLELCVLKSCCLVDPSRKTQGVITDTHVLINPRLLVHEFVMGLNTMHDMELTICPIMNQVLDTRQRRFRLLSRQRAVAWDDSFGERDALKGWKWEHGTDAPISPNLDRSTSTEPSQPWRSEAPRSKSRSRPPKPHASNATAPEKQTTVGRTSVGPTAKGRYPARAKTAPWSGSTWDKPHAGKARVDQQSGASRNNFSQGRIEQI